MANFQPLRVQCRGCSRFRSPHEFIHSQVTGFCWHCYEWHGQALRLLQTGEPPKGCPECGRSMGALIAAAGGGDVTMRVYPKDGIYQILCVPCGDAYEAKRPDLFRRTPYGAAKKL